MTMKKIPCKNCNGTGVCPVCKGKGYKEVFTCVICGKKFTEEFKPFFKEENICRYCSCLPDKKEVDNENL